MIISKNGLDLIKHFESLQLKAYKCSANVWTIGYGHTKNVKEGDRICEDQANCFLMQDLYSVERAIIRLVKVKINQNHFELAGGIAGLAGWSGATLIKALEERLIKKASGKD